MVVWVEQAQDVSRWWFIVSTAVSLGLEPIKTCGILLPDYRLLASVEELCYIYLFSLFVTKVKRSCPCAELSTTS